MKKWRSYLVLVIGLLLLLTSFILYGIQVSQASPATGSAVLSGDQLGQQYGTDRIFIEQYGVFLLLFLLGLTLVCIYGTIGIRRPDNPVGLVPQFIIVLVLLSNAVTTMNSLAVASKAIVLSLPAFWTFLAVAALGLANVAFVLVIWNGFRWGLWAYGVGAFLLFVLKFAGSVPIIPSIIELSAVIILIYLLRPIWSEMD
jgi:hypothetical protein